MTKSTKTYRIVKFPDIFVADLLCSATPLWLDLARTFILFFTLDKLEHEQDGESARFYDEVELGMAAHFFISALPFYFR